MDWISDPNIWIGFFMLTALEIVLGIDNIVFISIVAGKLPAERQAAARKLGLLLAMGTRILLLFTITWMAGLTEPFFVVFGHGFSGKDLILLIGGLFLIAKAVSEIHTKLEGDETPGEDSPKPTSFAGVIVQILAIDVVFSLDSVITAVGVSNHLWVMVAAVVTSVFFMLGFAGSVSDFVDKHPTVKMLALAFLVLIGVNLVADGFGQHIPRGYTYFAMAFSVMVEMLNLKLRKRSHVVQLHKREPR
jgi:predicted tellurium resistance membrane protein TerC